MEANSLKRQDRDKVIAVETRGYLYRNLALVLVSFFLSSVDGIGVEFSSGDGSWRRPAARIQHIQVLCIPTEPREAMSKIQQ